MADPSSPFSPQQTSGVFKSQKKRSPRKRRLSHSMLHDTTPVVPLSLDSVLGDVPVTSSLPIFRLPVELLNHIMPYLSPMDLKNFSLVDRDTNQLARTYQFAHVTLDYSDHAMQLFTKLKHEANFPVRRRRRIAHCIRRLRVSTARHIFNAKEGVILAELEDLSTQDRLGRINAAKQTEARYLRTICDLLRHLPNLHILDWNDEGPLTADMMKSIMYSSISHLRLDGPIFNSQFTLPPKRDGAWNLESLYLDIGWSFAAHVQGETAPFVSSILSLVAPTLRQLIWCGYTDRLSPPTHHYEGNLEFPVLRDVVIDQVRFKDSSFLQKILRDRTTIRSLTIDSSPIVSEYLASRGQVPSLTSFCWEWDSSTSEGEMLEFIHSNSQLSSLEVTAPLLPTSITTLLTRHNQIHFDYLVSLHLVSQEQEFPVESLDLIASIKPLQHLWLSAGAQFGMRHQWVIDHEMMMEALKDLSRLQTLVFTRDSYRVNGHPLLDCSPERYYLNKILPQDLSLNDYLTDDELTKAHPSPLAFDHSIRLRETLRSLTWERWHLSQMVMHATEYSRVFPKLKWCFMGQLPMRIEENLFWKIAEPETSDRDPSLRMVHGYWVRVVKNMD